MYQCINCKSKFNIEKVTQENENISYTGKMWGTQIETDSEAENLR